MSSRNPFVAALPIGVAGRPEPAVAEEHHRLRQRVCAWHQCNTRLSAYNPGIMCGIHEHNEAHNKEWERRWS